jgi:hypothetical protein
MYGDHKTYAAMSTDMGKTWKKFSSDEFTGFAHKIKQDLKNRDLLFLGTEMGLFATVDGGASWFRMKNNIPWYALVRDIQIHPATNDLVLGSHGRGIMIVDDISPMRAMTKEVVDQDVYIFDPKPVTLTMGTFGSGGFPSTGGWVAPNAPSIPPIQYYLKDRVSSGKVQLDIYDAAGKLVQSIPGTTRKGINNISWNLRTKPPKTASGATKRDFGAFIAPQVLPGDYTMKLSVAGKDYSKPLKLVHDPKSDFTLADRELQYKTSMELYRMHEDLAKTVAEIADKQKVLKENLPNIKNAKLKKQVQDYYDQLETLRAELIPTKQTSIFADETRLREDITDVYSSVAMTEAAPNNLQIDRVKDLRTKVDQAEQKRKQIEGQYESKIKGAMSSVEKSEGKK